MALWSISDPVYGNISRQALQENVFFPSLGSELVCGLSSLSRASFGPSPLPAVRQPLGVLLWFADLSKLGTGYHSALGGGKKPGSSQLGLSPLPPASLLLTPQLMGPSGVLCL